MSIHHSLAKQWNSQKNIPAKHQVIQKANAPAQSKKIIQFIDELLDALQSKKGFKEFAFFVTKDSSVQDKLKKTLDKSSVIEHLVQFAKEQGYKFTDGDVQKAFGEWCKSSSMEALLSQLVDWAKGDILQFLTEIKNTPSLKKELDKTDTPTNFVTFLKKTFNEPERQNKYQAITEGDIEKYAKLISPDEPDPQKNDEPAKERIVGRILC